MRPGAKTRAKFFQRIWIGVFGKLRCAPSKCFDLDMCSCQHLRMNELFYSMALCVAMFGGEPETRTQIDLRDDRSHVRADCRTDTHYIEIGFDNKAGARDSVHQAIFGAFETGLQPMVVIIDQDGIEDTHQYELETVARLTGTEFRLIHVNTALRVAMARHFWERRREILSSTSGTF